MVGYWSARNYFSWVYCRIFISTQAGGVGLNRQSAEVVVKMDLPWNPAVLEQRVGRVHRLGQKKPVRVINFVTKGSIEHGMLTVLSPLPLFSTR